MSPVGLVRSLLTQRAFLARAATGVLSDDEQRAILRPARRGRRVDGRRPAAHRRGRSVRQGRAAPFRPSGRRRSPGPLADAAADARAPRAAPFDDGARRSRAGDRSRRRRRAGRRRSSTSDGPPTRSRRSSRMGYRLPGAFLALANRLLPVAAPGVAASRSVRADGDPPDIARVPGRSSRPRDRRPRARARRGVRLGRGHRGRPACRRAAPRDRGSRRRARGAGRGRARPPARRVVGPPGQGPRVRCRDRRGAGRDRGRGAARLAAALRRAYTRRAASRARARAAAARRCSSTRTRRLPGRCPTRRLCTSRPAAAAFAC